MQLLDYAWARPPVSALGGYAGAVRYLSYDKTGKNLTPVEALALTLAGKLVVSNWEWYADLRHDPDWHLHSPYDLGRQHARDALVLHRACGAPATAPIYVSGDFNVPDYAPQLPETPGNAVAKLGPLADYWRGWVDQLGAGRVGGYGGYWLIRRLLDAGLIAYAWQTRAWSGTSPTLWDPRAHVRQVASATVGGARVDINDVMRSAYGGWQVAQTHGGGTVGSPQDGWKDVVVAAPKPDGMGGPADGIRLGDWVGWTTAQTVAILAAAEGAQAAANQAAATAARIEQIAKTPVVVVPPPAPAPPVALPGQIAWDTVDGQRLVLTVASGGQSNG